MNTHKTTPVDFIFVPNFGELFNAIQTSVNWGLFCPARGTRDGSSSVRFRVHLKTNKFVPI